MVFSWPLPPFPFWGMPEVQAVPWFSLQLMGDVAALRGRCTGAHSPAFAPSILALLVHEAGDPAVVWILATHTDSQHRSRACSRTRHPYPNGGAELVSHGGSGAVTSQSEHRAPPSHVCPCPVPQQRGNRTPGSGKPRSGACGEPRSDTADAWLELINSTDPAMPGQPSHPAMSPILGCGTT